MDRDTVRSLVREELVKRLSTRRPVAHPALGEIHPDPLCTEDLDLPVRRACLIEPHRPCYNSGYCKKLGY